MVQRYVHIGYPKCASTSLQYFYFTRHPEMYHLGWGCSHTPSGWVTDDVAAAFEVDMRMAKTRQYRPEVTRAAIGQHFEWAEKLDYKAVGVSWESLCFTLVYDVDVALKAARLFHAFGKGTKIVVVLRNQLQLIRSMYFELVRGGMSKTFEEYLEFLYYWRFTGMTTDLLYDDVLATFAALFGADNIVLVPFESLAEDNARELKRISGFLGLSDAVQTLGRLNATEDLRVLERVRKLNAGESHDFGAPLFSHLYPGKMAAYWAREGLEFPESARVAMSMREKHFSRAQGEVDDTSPELDTTYPPTWESRFASFYAGSNRKVGERWGLDLGALGYPV